MYYDDIVLKEFISLKSYLKKYKFYYLAGIFCLLLTNTGQLFIPQILKNVIDHLSLSQPDMIYIENFLRILVLTAFLIASGRIGWRYFIIGSARKIEATMREKIYESLVLQSSSFYGKTKTGDLMARATNDLDAVRGALGMALVAFVDGMFLTIAILVLLFSQNLYT